jgi:hypothetical protein
MLKFEFLPARHGDSFLVRWGTPERVMVVDGGPDRVYEEVLRPHLLTLPHAPGAAPVIDAVCVTHVDDDHIVGIQQLLKELARKKKDQLPLPFDIRCVWFNSVDKLIDSVQPGLAAAGQVVIEGGGAHGAVEASYAQGSDVRSNIVLLNLDGNRPFGDVVTAGMRREVHGLEITVVGPNTRALNALVKKWRASVKTKKPDAIAAAFSDRSVPNLSSVAMHIRHRGRTALLTGDARGDQLLAGLESVGLIAPGRAMHVDVFKLPHHGSENNADAALFQRIRADHYVICADGIKHDHPSTATLDWLVASRPAEDGYVIHLTHENAPARLTLESRRAGRAFTVAVRSPFAEISLADLTSPD